MISARRREHAEGAAHALPPFWSLEPEEAMRLLRAGRDGLAEEEAARRLAAFGPNRPGRIARGGALRLLLAQFGGAINALLVASAALAWLLGDATEALLIFAILLLSSGLGFWQHHAADRAVARLLALVESRALVLRGGAWREVPLAAVVPGDVVSLRAGSAVPGDCLLLEAKDLSVNEAALTGESFPVPKRPGRSPADAPLPARRNALFLGTYVVSGSGLGLVAATGRATELGRIAQRLGTEGRETEFERGSQRFGYFLLEVTLVLVLVVFAVNVELRRPVLTSLLFALALAVGLTPQLLPAIVTVTLAQGARSLARRRVIVRRLSAIENLGAMDLLCADKTGTVTEGAVRLHSALDAAGRPSPRVALYAYLNATLQAGFRNPVDEALADLRLDAAGWRRLDEVPYDFARRRLSVLVDGPDGTLLITKGALDSVLAVCRFAERDGATVPLGEVEEELRRRYAAWGNEGLRVLGLAVRPLGPDDAGAPGGLAGREEGLTFAGFLLFHDPVKADAAGAVAELARRGVAFKLITGDNRVVAAYVWRQLGLGEPRVTTGSELARTAPDALPARAAATDVFAEVDPVQKERVILALRRTGRVVGYLGDGINDGPALRAADVGISVSSAVDVAREAADIVLLVKDLGILCEGVDGGRRTFANTMKYIFISTSANFGNMFSMAGASLVLPFLPLLPPQILLTNFLTDLPEMTIATDAVDPELVARPRRWDIGFIRRFMVAFGLLSSAFDYLTFLTLLALRAPVDHFRTGWFQESVISAVLIVLVIRSRRPFWQSRPAPSLAAAAIAVVAGTLLLPLTPLGRLFGFTPLPGAFLLALAGIVALYVASAEVLKGRFYRRGRIGGPTGASPAAAT